jgi:segregation and condensation protein A
MPYQKILELAKTKDLDITTVDLAKITNDFINYLQSLEDKVDPHILADFISIAAKLMLIKSKALLPSLTLTEDEEEDIKELETRLQLYQQYQGADKQISQLWQDNNISASRPYLLACSLEQRQVFHTPSDLTTAQLLEAIKSSSLIIQKLFPDKEQLRIRVVSLKDKIKEIIGRFQKTSQYKFSQLANQSQKGEMIATFLAILHLLKDRVVDIDQPQPFEEITIKKI